MASSSECTSMSDSLYTRRPTAMQPDGLKRLTPCSGRSESQSESVWDAHPISRSLAVTLSFPSTSSKRRIFNPHLPPFCRQRISSLVAQLHYRSDQSRSLNFIQKFLLREGMRRYGSNEFTCERSRTSSSRKAISF